MSAAEARTPDEWKAELQHAPATLLLAELKQRDIAGTIELVERRPTSTAAKVIVALCVWIPLAIVMWRWALG